MSDRLRQKRFHPHRHAYQQFAMGNIPSDELLADASDIVSESGHPESEISWTRVPSKKPSCKPVYCAEPERYTGWVTPFGEYAREKSQHQTPEFNMGIGGVVAGFEWNKNQNVIGLGAAYVYTHIHEKKGAGHGNVNQGLLTVYGTLTASDWYFDLGLWGGYYHSDNQRNISFPGFSATAKSDTHGWQLAPHFEVGYDGLNFPECGCKWFSIEPFFMGDWVANWQKGFKEHGAGMLNMGQKGNFSSLVRGETGLRFYEVAEFNWGKLVFEEKASYAYQKAFHTGSVTSFLVGSPGAFTVTTLTGAQNLGVAEFSMLFIFNNLNAPYINIRYQGEFGSKYQSHQVMLEISKDF
jgi:uncharacterized protein with beta-barrel porin domain